MKKKFFLILCVFCFSVLCISCGKSDKESVESDKQAEVLSNDVSEFQKSEIFRQCVYIPQYCGVLENGKKTYQDGAITVEIADGKKVIINGKPTELCLIPLKSFTVGPGKYEWVLTGRADEGSTADILIQIANGEDVKSYSYPTVLNKTSTIFEFDEETDLVLRLMLPQGSVANNIEFETEFDVYQEAYQFESSDELFEALTETYKRTGRNDLLANSDRLICTFIDDDTMSVEAIELYAAACEENGVYGTYATLASKWENDPDMLNKLYDVEERGHEIIPHAYSQDIGDCWSTKDVDECYRDLVKCIRLMKQKGLGNTRMWATPNNISDYEFRTIAQRLGMECRVVGYNDYNRIDDYNMNRFDIHRVALTQSQSSLDEAESLALNCANDNGWLVVMTHFGTWTEGDYSIFSAYVDYLKSLDYEFMPLSQAWYYKEPLYDLMEMY